MMKTEKEMLASVQIKDENDNFAVFEETDTDPFVTLEGYRVEFSKSGLPCMWESGGGATNTGGAKIICSSNGLPKKAIYIPRGGHLSNGEHALIPVTVGDIIIFHSHDRKGAETEILKIKKIVGEKAYTVTVEMQNCYKTAVEAAIKKANTYHCRDAMYVK